MVLKLAHPVVPLEVLVVLHLPLEPVQLPLVCLRLFGHPLRVQNQEFLVRLPHQCDELLQGGHFEADVRAFPARDEDLISDRVGLLEHLAV